ncbi:MAG TPA: MFS transporter [Vicinamibacterales bacterium]|nr:MFS transporter [Vicinamibacterales bacterium]
MDERQSRRNILAAAAAGGIGFTGFTLVMPFLPLYIAELGTTDVGEIAMWTGLTLGATPTVTAISAPLWGRVGDKYGSKLLVIRSLTAFILTKAGMAFVTAPWQLFALRALLGVFAGYGALTMSMAAQSAPRDRMAHAIGLVQTGHRLGPAIGPVIGGVLAPLVGLRSAFLVAACFYAAAMLLIIVVYQEPPKRAAAAKARGGWEVFSQLMRLPGFLLALLVIFGLQTVDRSFGPVLPLFVQQVGVDGPRIAFVAGVLFSLGAISAAAGSQLGPRLLTRYSAKTILVAGTLTASLALAAIVAAPSVWVLGVAIVIAGTAMGAGTTTIYSVAGGLLPADAHATGFGIMTTASLMGLAVSPVVAGFIGAAGLRIVFVADVVLLLVLALLIGARLRSQRTGTDSEDAVLADP